MYNTIEQLNKILTSCDQLLTDCGCAASRGLMHAIAGGFLVISYACNIGDWIAVFCNDLEGRFRY